MTREGEKLGRYEVVKQLGEGAQGCVYLARDPTLDREVALKVPRGAGGGDHASARTVARLRHPNLARLYDAAEDGSFLVFEHVPGPTLRERCEGTGGLGRPFDLARIAAELGSALTAMHDAGVVHGDVNPDNVIVSPAGAVLVDLGLGGERGAIAYAAPEVLGGSSRTAASDQFSLAVTLYEAASGRRAFVGEDLRELAERVTSADPPPLVREDMEFREKLTFARMDGVLRRALRKDPATRYASCRAFGDAFASAIDIRASSGFNTLPLHSTSIVPRATRRWQNIALAIAVGVILFLLLLGRKAPKDHPDFRPSAVLSR